MSVQIFLRGKLLGIEALLTAPSDGADAAFIGRSNWVNLLSEILPRALLADFSLSSMLLGASGGDQFLVVLPSEYQERADEFMRAAAADAAALSGGKVRLIWAITENLGDWTDIRRRLRVVLDASEGAPALDASFFAEAGDVAPNDEYFTKLAGSLRESESVGWWPSAPARIFAGEGQHVWPIDGTSESISFPRHLAPVPDEATGQSSSVPRGWSVLRGDVDNFGIRLRRLATIEEHLQLSHTYKQFFAGELKILCSMKDFWQRTNILYSGGDDFAVYGDWDALLGLAREIQRVFHRFAEENMKELPGPEAKTISMALAVDSGNGLAHTFAQAGDNLDLAKSSDKDCIYALGRTLEWKQLADAAEIKDDLTTLIAKFGASPEYLREMCGLYRETGGTRSGTKRSRASERPWRFHRRMNRILPAGTGREEQKVRQNIITGFAGRNPANVKLRPSGRVALEWARLLAAKESE